VGTEFQVTTYTNSSQTIPVTAMNSDGSFVVAWSSIGQDGHQCGVFGQRFDSNGNKSGSEFLVNTYTTWSQSVSDIAMDPDGNFTIVWSGCYGGYGVSLGQRFNSNGNKLGSEFQVNTSTRDHRLYPSIGIDSNGNFVVVWESSFQDGSEHGIFGQRFGSNGNKIGSEFQVNTYTSTTIPLYYCNIIIKMVYWYVYLKRGGQYAIYQQKRKAYFNSGREKEINKN